MKYVQYDKDGNILTYFDDEIHTDIPENTIKLTEDQYRDCIDNAFARKVNINTKKINKVNNSLSLDLVKQEYLDAVDRHAGKKRLQHITSTAGQEGTYQLKAEQAQKYLKDSSPNEEDYPFIYQEAEALGVQAKDLAEVIVAKQKEWILLAAKIEALRIKAKVIIGKSKKVDLDKNLEDFCKQLEEVS